MLVAPPVAGYSERVYQVFGKEVLDQLIPIAALQPLERIGLPQPPPWRRKKLKRGGASEETVQAMKPFHPLANFGCTVLSPSPKSRS